MELTKSLSTSKEFLAVHPNATPEKLMSMRTLPILAHLSQTIKQAYSSLEKMKIEKLDKFDMKLPDDLFDSAFDRPSTQPTLQPFNVIKPDPEPVETPVEVK